MWNVRMIVALLVVAGSHAATHAATLQESGARFADAVRYAGEVLPAYSTGLFRWNGIFKVYSGALYLSPGHSAGQYREDISKCITLNYFRDFDGEDIGPAGDEVMARMYSPADMARLSERLRRFNAAYRSVTKNDQYRLCYAPGHGTTLAFNGEDLVTIEGADFAAAYFSLWLGEDPVNERLRDALYTPLNRR